MMKFIPLIVLVAGTGAGIAGGIYLQPQGDEEALEVDITPATDGAKGELSDSETDVEFVKLNNQFIIPVVDRDTVRSLVVVSLGLEISSNETGSVFSAEPKLRDAFLQVLFDHANVGGFDREFTNFRNLDYLREALTATARSILGKAVVSVLITDLARQDV